MRKFIEKLIIKDNGIIFCQVNKILITNHEISLDILISQKCRGPIAIFNAIKIVIKILILLLFSNETIFIKYTQENK